MNYDSILAESKKIDKYTEKNKVVQKILNKVENGQVIRIWFRFYIIFSSTCNK